MQPRKILIYRKESFSSLRRGFDIRHSLGCFPDVDHIHLYVMAFLFESVLMPLSIVFTIPLAGIGAVWIHYITGVNMDMLGDRRHAFGRRGGEQRHRADRLR